MRTPLLSIALVLPTTACNRPDTPAPATSAAATPASATAVPSTGVVAAAPSASETAPSSSVKPLSSMLTPTGFSIPDKPSKPPTVAQWNAASDAKVNNAEALGCEVRFVREWIRVSCRTAVTSSEPVQSVTVVKPEKKPADFYDFVTAGVASIVVPIRKDTDVRVEFGWKNFTRGLNIAWRSGQPLPLVYFAGPPPAGTSPNTPLCSLVCPIGGGYPSLCNYPQPDGAACIAGYRCVGINCICNAAGKCANDIE